MIKGNNPYRLIVLILVIIGVYSACLSSQITEYQASGYGGSPCGIFVDKEKNTFEGGEPIPIRISTPCEALYGTVIIIKVTTAEQKLEESGYATTNLGKTYLEKELQVNGAITEVLFDPNDVNIDEEYRFLVTLQDRANAILDQTMIFTKKHADEIIIQRIDAPANVIAGESGVFTIEISDGLQKPIASIIRVFGLVQRPVCGSGIFPENEIGLEFRREGISDTASTYRGTLDIAESFPSGKYDVLVSIAFSGYQTVQKTLQVSVQGKTPPVTSLFYNVSVKTTNILSRNNNPIFAPGEDIVIVGQTLTDDCLPLEGVEIIGDMFRPINTLIRSETTSDRTGNFTLHFQTYPQMKHGESYEISIKSHYLNKTFMENPNNNISISLQNIHRYNFEADGRNASAEAMVIDGGNIVSFSLDKNAKEIAIVLDGATSSDSPPHYEIALPAALLSGDLVIQLNGSEVISLSEAQQDGSVWGPEIDPANGNYRVSYNLLASKAGGGDLFLTFEPTVGGQTTIVITGTNVIPEFSSSVFMIAAVSGTTIVLVLKKCHFWRHRDN